METKALAVFQDAKIRRVWHDGKWFFSVVDVIGALTESPKPSLYWRVLKNRLRKEGSDQTVTNCNAFKFEASDGKMRLTDCADTETLFRLVQSVPSPKAEPFKMWLASVGYDRVREIQDPELATDRARELYRAKGYPEAWIEKRMRGIAIRQELTDEWKGRGAQEDRDFGILTAEISKATFGLTPSEYKDLKGLSRQNLRDHMGDLELIFTMLGERATTEIHRVRDSRGVPELKQDANVGGSIAGNACRELEEKLGRSVVSRENFLGVAPAAKRLGERKKKSGKRK